MVQGFKMIKYEFDNIEEYEEARKNLEKYHNCEKCHNKIVVIAMDQLGNTHCGYCGEIVRYPKLKKEVFEKWLKNQK